MKRLLTLFLVMGSWILWAQNGSSSYEGGEYLKYKIHYGLINAGFTSLEVRQTGDENVLHAIGKGWTTGMVGMVFSVDDNYETFFDKNTHRPRHFIRKVNEGGYTKDKEVFFDFEKHRARVVNHKKETDSTYFIQNDVKDLLQSFYYLRSLDFEGYKENDAVEVRTFFDEQMYTIKVLVLGRERLKTKFGEIDCIIIRPLVMEGRVFKDEENVTLWVSDDKNKIPIKIKASILVGSVKADLIEATGLAHPFELKI
ncbi:MAG: DUF3108 domain-containing protein [Lutimonas sp.]